MNYSQHISSATRAWIARLALSLLFAAVAGALAYLTTRAITSALLFANQQQFLSEAAGALRGGIAGLAGSDLHAMRLLVQQREAQNEQLSLLVGFAAAALTSAASYLWLEWRAVRPGD